MKPTVLMPWLFRRTAPLAPLASLTFGACSDVGLIRRDNQDHFGVFPEQRPTLFVVADGMGGHADGGTASRVAVETLAEAFLADEGPATHRLASAVRAANAAVWREAQNNGGPRRMGTTCTALAIEMDRAVLAHVGDSRAYRVSGAGLEQLSPDHTLVAELIARGLLTEAEAARHPQRHVLTRALGVGPEVDAFVEDLGPTQPGDTYVLCSDGLAPVEAEEVGRVAAGYGPQAAAEWLVARANALGGPDNITVIVIRLHPGAD